MSEQTTQKLTPKQKPSHPASVPQASEGALASLVEDTPDAGARTVLLQAAQSRLLAGEASQRQAAETQAAILNSIPAHIALLDSQGVILVVNEAWSRFATVHTLQSPAYRVGSNYLEACELATGDCAADAIKAGQGMRQVLRGEADEFALEYPCHSPEAQHWFRLVVTRVSAEHLAGAVVMHIEITEQRVGENALRASEEEFRTLSEAMPQIVWTTRPDGWTLYINQRWMDYTGCTLAEGLGHGWKNSIHPDDQPRALAAWQLSSQTGVTYSTECRLRRADGAYLWWLIRGAALKDAAGNILRWLGTCTDIDELKQAQTRITEQAALIDQAGDAILVRDLEGHITFWNQGAERLYGWTTVEAVGRMFNELLLPELDKFHDAQDLVLREGAWSGEIHKSARRGAVITVDARWTLLRDAEGIPKAILSFDTDITQRKQMEHQFLRAQRMESIGTLAGGIAHDLNNLLAPILMGVGVLRIFEPSPPSVAVIDNIERSARRGADLVKQVLSFARGMEGTRVALQIRHILHEVEAIATSTFPKNITIETSLPNDLWPVLADPTQLNQVALNLCVNARDAMPNGGRIELAASNVEIDEPYAVMHRGVVAGRYVMIRVTDNGLGMPKAIVDRIFEPFFTTKEVGKGTGLGLSTVMSIVRSHGGFVNVESEPGKGSTFKVHLLALANGAPALFGPPEENLPRGNGELILVVDDEAPIRQIAVQTLETFGYKVITAEDGARAIGLYGQHRQEVAVVLTDMMMPVMDGPTLVSALRHINPLVRIIAMSGLTAKANVARVSKAGVTHFLPKPYSTETLLTKLKAVLSEKS